MKKMMVIIYLLTSLLVVATQASSEDRTDCFINLPEVKAIKQMEFRGRQTIIIYSYQRQVTEDYLVNAVYLAAACERVWLPGSFNGIEAIVVCNKFGKQGYLYECKQGWSESVPATFPAPKSKARISILASTQLL